MSTSKWRLPILVTVCYNELLDSDSAMHGLFLLFLWLRVLVSLILYQFVPPDCERAHIYMHTKLYYAQIFTDVALIHAPKSCMCPSVDQSPQSSQTHMHGGCTMTRQVHISQLWRSECMTQIIATTFDSVKSFGQRGRGFGRFLNPVGLTVGKQGATSLLWRAFLSASQLCSASYSCFWRSMMQTLMRVASCMHMSRHENKHVGRISTWRLVKLVPVVPCQTTVFIANLFKRVRIHRNEFEFELTQVAVWLWDMHE